MVGYVLGTRNVEGTNSIEKRFFGVLFVKSPLVVAVLNHSNLLTRGPLLNSHEFDTIQSRIEWTPLNDEGYR